MILIQVPSSVQWHISKHAGQRDKSAVIAFSPVNEVILAFILALQVTGDGGDPTQHTDEEGLVDQFVALWIDQVELERQAASLLPLLVAILQQACKT